MICTCTMNPSLDYYMEFEKPIEKNGTNRSQLEYYEAGGKGINVSIVLNNLGIPTRATGFLGGFTREFYITLLQKYEYIQPNFTYIDGHTRINVKLSEDGKETDLNAAGPYITNTDMENLHEKVRRLDEGDYFVLAGVCPQYLQDDVEAMLREAIQDRVRVCLDTNMEIMENLLPEHPFLIKTTSNELSVYLKKDLSAEEIEKAVEKIHKQGAENVMALSSDTKEAFLSCRDGAYKCRILHHQKAINTVGTGDALVAGFLMNYLRSSDPVDSFRFGACCGSATAYSKGMATREKIDSFYEETKVEKVNA